jgi:hypothetical protein
MCMWLLLLLLVVRPGHRARHAGLHAGPHRTHGRRREVPGRSVRKEGLGTKTCAHAQHTLVGLVVKALVGSARLVMAVCPPLVIPFLQSYVFGSHRTYSGVNGSSGSNRVILSAWSVSQSTGSAARGRGEECAVPVCVRAEALPSHPTTLPSPAWLLVC